MFKKTALLIFILLIFFFIIFFKETRFETNLIKTILPASGAEALEITAAANKSASVIKIFFEGGEEQKEQFLKQIDYNAFEINKIDVSKFIEAYKKAPAAFLSDKSRELIKGGRFDELYNNALNKLYNPVSFSLTPFYKDPYFLNADFIEAVKSETPNGENTIELKIKSETGLSQGAANKEISKLLKTAGELSSGKGKIYAAGAPVHSYYTAQKASMAVNIISVLSVLFISAVSFYYFRSFKILVPIFCAAAFGIAAGFCAVKLIFSDFQVLTMLYAASITGLCIDYSFHYFFAAEHNGKFFKNLAFSLLTTIIPFILFYLTAIELLKQTAVFSAAALSAVFFFVLLYYPRFKNFIPPVKSGAGAEKRNTARIYAAILCAVTICAAAGLHNLRFNDSLSAFYTPSKELIQAEKLYNEAALIKPEIQMLKVKGADIQEILQKEETAAAELKKQGINYAALSKFFPSKQRQSENIRLVRELYKNNLSRFEGILSKVQINELKEQKIEPLTPHINEFMLNENTSIMYIFSSKPLTIEQEGVKIINPQKSIEKYLKDYKDHLIRIFPASLIFVLIILCAAFGFMRGIKILLPSLITAPLAAGMSALVQGELNFFSLISLFLVFGFTIDYAVFKSGCREAARAAEAVKTIENTHSAVTASALTTAFSFLLLSFAPFKLISSIAQVLFFGIVISYLISCLMFDGRQNRQE